MRQLPLITHIHGQMGQQPIVTMPIINQRVSWQSNTHLKAALQCQECCHIPIQPGRLLQHQHLQ